MPPITTPLYALVDCNNFYVSCERAFDPYLENKPVVVLSNNDGCIISRSNEAKQLNIPMGAPYFKWKLFCEENNVHVFSSNYELYGDMSQRVMALLKDFNAYMEIYSIDEAFLQFDKTITDAELTTLRNFIKQATGMPISIGLAPTKTLAKIANQLAKSEKDKNVFILTDDTPLTTFPVQKIWGIGRNLSAKLINLGIDTAFKLKKADAKMIRMHFSVVVEKTVRELNGIPCLELEKNQPRKQIISSRSFGKTVTQLSEIEEAVSHYTNLAAQKLRKQHSVASALHVFLQTSNYSDRHSQYGNSLSFAFPVPTADTRYLIHIAKKCVRQIFNKHCRYNKAGIMLLDIRKNSIQQYDMLKEVVNPKSERVMAMLDSINANFGRNTIFIAAEGIKREWLIKSDMRSLRYTTRWQELPTVFCTM